MSSVDVTELASCVMEHALSKDYSTSIEEMATACGCSREEVLKVMEAYRSAGWFDTPDSKGDRAAEYWAAYHCLIYADRNRLYEELVRQSWSIVRELSKRTEQTAIISALDDFHGKCVYRAETDSQIRLISEVGRDIPLHAGATGKVLLAFAPANLRRHVLSGELKSFTPFTVTDPVTLRAQLESIRTHGYAFTREEVDPGASSLGVPILAMDGDLLAVLSIAGAWFDFEDRQELFLREMKKTVSHIKQRLSLDAGDTTKEGKA